MTGATIIAATAVAVPHACFRMAALCFSRPSGQGSTGSLPGQAGPMSNLFHRFRWRFAHPTGCCAPTLLATLPSGAQLWLANLDAVLEDKWLEYVGVPQSM